MAAESRIPGTVLSPGTVSGPAVLAGEGQAIAIRKGIPVSERAAELAALESAVDASIADLVALAARVAGELGADKAEIFESHADILGDEEFRADLARLVTEEGYSAASAVRETTEAHAAEMEELDDEYFRARSDDFRDIGHRVIERILKPAEEAARERLDCFPPLPSVVVSRALSPGQTVAFHLPNVLGFVVSSGGVNSHAAILARSLGIPAIVIPEAELAKISNGVALALNPEPGILARDPCRDTLSLVASVREAEARHSEMLKRLLDLPGVTKCGTRIGLYANGGGMKDLAGITAARPDGIGLFRTEFLFMEEDAFPDESAQAAYYRRVLDAMGERPVIFRLLDIGADKPLPYAPHPKENNPFLGWRGIRWLIDNPDALLSQVRGMLSASAATGRTARIMVPMVCSPREMAIVKELVERQKEELGGEALVGMMVETPAAAMTVRAFKGLSAFISIGSNDLTQYTLAADRENGLIGDLYSEFHPGVLALMKKACEDAKACGMEAGICGEFASVPEGALYLAAMGFDELSMSPRGLPSVKEVIRSITLDRARSLLDTALTLGSAAETRALARSFLLSEGIGS